MVNQWEASAVNQWETSTVNQWEEAEVFKDFRLGQFFLLFVGDLDGV